MDKIYTTEQVAKILQVSIITIRRYIKNGKLPASKIGKDFRIKENDIDRFLEETIVKK